MREKFTLTPEDEKFMNSIGKGSSTTPALRRGSNLIKRAQANTKAIGRRIASGGVGKGKSHYSGKHYRYD